MTGGHVYLVSSMSVEHVQRALPDYTVIAKSNFLGDDVRLKYPFEVLAAVDYGMATAAPLYLAEPSTSSFDAFAAAERQRAGRSAVVAISTCGRTARRDG